MTPKRLAARLYSFRVVCKDTALDAGVSERCTDYSSYIADIFERVATRYVEQEHEQLVSLSFARAQGVKAPDSISPSSLKLCRTFVPCRVVVSF